MPDELLPIHGCQDPERVGDVVFVHGLNGNARDYWCHEGKPEYYWPAWLGEDLPGVGIWALGYENAAFKTRRLSFLRSSGYRGFAMPLSDRAKNVQLQLENNGIGQRPLVFVAHSMGGLLVKQLLRTANEKSTQKTWKAILKNTRGVCFIATPHIGSELAKWASYFRTILGVSVSIEELKPHDSQLRDLNDSYVSIVAREDINILTLSFIEKKPLIGDLLVVAEGDATLHVRGGTDYPLGEDHLSICKPQSKSSDIHLKLVSFVRSDCLQLKGNSETEKRILGPSLPPRPDASLSGTTGFLLNFEDLLLLNVDTIRDEIQTCLNVNFGFYHKPLFIYNFGKSLSYGCTMAMLSFKTEKHFKISEDLINKLFPECTDVTWLFMEPLPRIYLKVDGSSKFLSGTGRLVFKIISQIDKNFNLDNLNNSAKIQQKAKLIKHDLITIGHVRLHAEHIGIDWLHEHDQGRPEDLLRAQKETEILLTSLLRTVQRSRRLNRPIVVK